jgi:hypothetical protein
MVEQLLPAHAAAIGELLPGDDQAGIAHQLADGGSQLELALAALVHHSRAAELTAAFEQTVALGLRAFDELAAHAAACEVYQNPGPIERAFLDAARSLLDLYCALAAGAEPAHALDRFLADWSLVT